MPRKKTKSKTTKKKTTKRKPARKKTTKKKTPAKKKTKRKTTTKKKKKTAKKTAATKKMKTAGDIRVNKKAKTPSLLRGMKDLLPKDEEYWLKMRHEAESISNVYGYGKIETPIMEEASLFVRSIGRGTDVVDKEMYIFEDRDKTKIALRPEATASVMRSYISHGMQTLPQPVKVWYLGPMFRHDRPQAGRFRQFHQFGCESIGGHDPVIDAELIIIAYNFLKDLGINTTVHVNSIGTLDDRQNYIIELVGYLRSKRGYLCDDCKRRINKNPLRVLDCKQEQCQPVIEEAPQIIDWLSDKPKDFFMKVLEYLDELEVPYVLQSTLVRGLDYYTDTVFEFYEEDEEQKSQNALGGGGRYNGLSEQIGGQETPGCGFALGLERIVSVMKKKENKEENEEKKEVSNPIYFAQLGELARRGALKMIEELRKQGYAVKHNLAKHSLKSQLELANKFGVKYCFILGQKEIQDGTLIVRDMDSGIQEIIDQSQMMKKVADIFDKHGKNI
ncbi:MAG: histidine--tRNA ligase [Candidatus Magasanikbacteria bacterium]|nr:histidine--tRNA ligase [Candidatus Magasanikbacteria bacterium]